MINTTQGRVLVPDNRWMAHCAVRKDLAMKLTDLIVSPKSLGDKLWLVDVSPAYEYKDGKRSDTILGYRYSIALPEHELDKIDVRIDGQQQAEAPNGYVEVRFDGLEMFIYCLRANIIWAHGQTESIS